MSRKRVGILMLVASFCAAFSYASGQQGTKPDHPYAALCGEYLFDLSAIDSGSLNVKAFFENGQFFLQSSRSETPDVLTPVEGKEMKFTLDDPDEGRWDIEFMKNDAGKVTRLHLVNTGLGLDITGDKIEK